MKDPVAVAKLSSMTTIGEVEMAIANGRATYQTPIRWLDKTDEGVTWIPTTTGRVLFNALVPKGLPFLNKDMKKKALGELVFQRSAGQADARHPRPGTRRARKPCG